jgi:hypothetical protein
VVLPIDGNIARGNNRLRVLYQSTTSDSCGICSVANLLALYGIASSRKQVLELFRCSTREYDGVATHRLLSRALELRLASNSSLPWKRIAVFDFAKFSAALRESLDQYSPVLLTFHVRHRYRNWSGIHCSVAIESDHSGIGLIDSLGRRYGPFPNATIATKECVGGWPVSGAPVLVTKGPAYVLHGLPPLAALD